MWVILPNRNKVSLSSCNQNPGNTYKIECIYDNELIRVFRIEKIKAGMSKINLWL